MKLAIAIAACLLAAPALAQDIRVIDGDKFVMDGEVIRLWGIDAPELGQYCRAFGEPVPAGELAADVLESLLHSLSNCEPTGEQSYGRTIARCYQDDGDDLSAEMVAAGYAWDWPLFSAGTYADHAAAAAAAGLGLTTIECIPPWEWREQN